MSVRQDVTYAARLLWRSPLFTVTAVLSLAIGIAGNAAIFSLADALFLRPIPALADPGRLVEMGRTFRGQTLTNGGVFGNMSYPTYVDYRERNTVFQGLAAFFLASQPYGLGTGATADRVDGSRVSGNYFDVLGVRMALGRPLSLADEQPGAPPVTILTDLLWRSRFGADPAVVGRAIRLNGQSVTVVGVAPPGFTGHNIAVTELWLPLTFDRGDVGALADQPRNAQWLLTIGRLRSGVSIEQARAQMAQIAGDLGREYPETNTGEGVALVTWRAIPGQLALPAGAFLALLFALVGLVLLIACANVGGMLLARGVTRAREIAVRLALGAARGRIVRLLVTESLLLSMAGSLIGLGLALAFIRLLRALIPVLPIPLAIDFRLDWRVVAFSVLVSVIAGLLCGLLPALEAARADLASAIKADTAHGPRRARLRHAFVVAQVAASVLLVVTALLLGRSLLNASTLDPGFIAENLEVTSLDLRLAGYDEQRGAALVRTLVERGQGLPGVASIAATMVVPLTGADIGLGPVRLAGQAFDQQGAIFPIWNAVTHGYFETLGIPLVAGRSFTDADRAAGPEVIIVNETLARRLWPGQTAVGQILLQRSGGPEGRDAALEVVGIARDAKYSSIGEAAMPAAYLVFDQRYWSNVSLVSRTDGPSALASVRAMLRELDPNLPIVQAGTFADLTSFALVPYRAAAWVAGSVGVVGLLLAAIGIYGITAFNASRRTREIGIRMALGAVRSRVLRLVMRQSLVLAGTGAAIGLTLAAGAAQLLGMLLLGIQPLDPISFMAGAGLLATVTLVASILPAWRAAGLNPVEALRAE